MKVWFQNRRMKWRHQESKERREGRGGEEWSSSQALHLAEQESKEEQEAVSEATVDSTVDSGQHSGGHH